MERAVVGAVCAGVEERSARRADASDELEGPDAPPACKAAGVAGPSRADGSDDRPRPLRSANRGAALAAPRRAEVEAPGAEEDQKSRRQVPRKLGRSFLSNFRAAVAMRLPSSARIWPGSVVIEPTGSLSVTSFWPTKR